MTMRRLFLNILLAVGLLGSVLAIPTSTDAATVVRDSSGKSFTKAWELTASGSNWLMVYGYNESLINEDYTHTTHSAYNHTATVSNGSGAYSKNASKGAWAKIEVRHSGSYVQYSLTY